MCLNTKNQGRKKYSYATNQAKSFELWLKVSSAPCWLSYLTSVSKAYSQSLRELMHTNAAKELSAAIIAGA